MAGFPNRQAGLLSILIFLSLFASWQLEIGTDFRVFARQKEAVNPNLQVTWSNGTYAPPVIHQIFQTKEKSSAVLSLLVIGDWGGMGIPPFSTALQRAVAKALGEVAREENVSAVLVPGDVMYNSGVKKENDPRFNWTFERVYTNPSLNIPWYIVAGNHDHFSSIKPLIKYTNKSKRWVFPAPHYLVNMETSSNNAQHISVSIVMIDTWTLCGASGVGPRNRREANRSWIWIRDTLKRNRSTYLFVTGHLPTLSIGRHGPTPCLKRRMIELMSRFKATAYFSGHDHNLQHITSYDKTHNSTLHHFVVGAGAKSCGRRWHQFHVPKSSLKFFYGPPKMARNEGGFGKLKLSKIEGEFSFIDSKKRTLYTVKLQPRQFVRR